MEFLAAKKLALCSFIYSRNLASAINKNLNKLEDPYELGKRFELMDLMVVDYFNSRRPARAIHIYTSTGIYAWGYFISLRISRAELRTHRNLRASPQA